MNIKKTILENKYLALSKELISKIGLHESLLYCELVDRFYYLQSQSRLVDGYFYATTDYLKNNTGLSKYQQKKAEKSLTDLGLIEFEIRGMPAKKHYKINENIDIISVFFAPEKEQKNEQKTECTVVKKLNNKKLRNCTTRSEETKQQVVKKLHLNNTIYNTIDKTNNKERLTSLPTAVGNGDFSQSKLLDIKTSKPSSKKLTQRQLALEKISLAKNNKISWEDVSFRDFTFYYIEQHNKDLETIVYNRYQDVTIFRDCFIKKHKIPLNLVCDFIDCMLKYYLIHEKKKSSLSFEMIKTNLELINDLVKETKRRLKNKTISKKTGQMF